jgi:uncharacterized protein YciI
MPLYAINCLDKPDSLQLRLATRPSHVDYLKASNALRLAGPYLNGSGEPVGTLLIIEAADEQAAHDFAAADPYAKAGLFASTYVHAFSHTLGHLP